MSTFMANKGNIERKWYVIDAAGKPMGKTAVAAADLLRGKRKVTYTPHADCGDNVIIINADKVRLTGNKWTGRTYYTYSLYPGGQREHTPQSIFNKPNGPSTLVRKVVRGMLPKNRLGRTILGNLYVYEGNEHKHEAQSPKTIDINQYK